MRLLAQTKAVILARDNKHVLLSWATGVGKSLAAIKIIIDNIDSDTKINGVWNRWYIVVAEKQHIKNWEEEFRKHGYGDMLDLGYVEIFCYQSLHKYKGNTANLVLDEAHGVTDLRLDILQTIKADKIVSLSATVEYDRKAQLRELCPFTEYTITTDEAIKSGILATPIVVKIEMSILPRMEDQYHRLEQSIRSEDIVLEELKAKLASLITLTPTVDAIGDIKRLINEKEALILALKIRRKALIANSKTSHVQRLQKKFEQEGKKYIIFTGTLAQCKRISVVGARELGIYTGIPNKIVESRIEYFNKADKGGLVCLKMLRQGTNLEGIEVGVITQLDAKQLSFIQMMGRIFRSKRPVLFVLVAKDTVDEIYWDTCTKDLDPSYIMTYNQYLAHVKA